MRKLIAKYFPFLGAYKRMFTAFSHSTFSKQTYSQHKEDLFLVNKFNERNLNTNEWMYVDVGANHPTDISNTYLLYKHGLRGVIVEPNKELIKLFKWFRPLDIRLPIGCSNKSSILRFFISKTPVISSFENDWMDSEVYDSYYVPVMCLDDAVSNLIDKKIFLLSIDVEGLNYEVLEGAKNTIDKSLFICVEFDDEKDLDKYQKILGNECVLVSKIGCNAIFKNNKCDKV